MTDWGAGRRSAITWRLHCREGFSEKASQLIPHFCSGGLKASTSRCAPRAVPLPNAGERQWAGHVPDVAVKLCGEGWGYARLDLAPAACSFPRAVAWARVRATVPGPGCPTGPNLRTTRKAINALFPSAAT